MLDFASVLTSLSTAESRIDVFSNVSLVPLNVHNKTTLMKVTVSRNVAESAYDAGAAINCQV
jgi:hypothetical protein